MLLYKTKILLIPFCLFVLNLQGQEIVSGLIVNKELKAQKSESTYLKSLSVQDTIELPFFDDFSASGIFPSNSLWTDKYVYINNTYPIKQRSQGVATFDAIDNTGIIYEGAGSFVFEADHLSSLPINLSYAASENIFLSFLYQPQGIADPPEESDSLILQFYSPTDDLWYSKWMVQGSGLRDFKAVIIKIDEARYLHKGFRFRFINHASLSDKISENPDQVGNCDHWNIDYVFLDKNRTNNDTIAADIAFTAPLRSVLNTYEAMPWNQFRIVFLSEMGSFIRINYRNNDQITRNVTRNFEITDISDNSLVHSFSAGATNIESYQNIEYNANLIYTFSSTNSDSAIFRIRSILKTDDFDRKTNDTTDYLQVFKNYFAFDDGTAEGGYGVNGGGSSNAMVASLFRSYIPDTLRSLMVSFNDSYMSSNQRYFDIAVWSNNNGSPGELLYEQEEMVDPGDEVNGFINFVLNDPVAVNGYFFVGWRQKSETFLNVGLDLNTPHQGRRFYYLNGIWSQSEAAGSLLIRPVLGKASVSSGINNMPGIENNVKIWPNPVKDYLYIDFGRQHYLNDNITIRIFDSLGRLTATQSRSEYIDVTALRDGLYFLIVYSGNKKISYNKFIRVR